jgi:hypothetical protein
MCDMISSEMMVLYYILRICRPILEVRVCFCFIVCYVCYVITFII